MSMKKAAPAGAAPADHSRVVGGSSAHMRMECPGSYQMEQKLPPAAAEESSSYADEGTACHEAMALMIEQGLDVDAVLGMEFGREGAKFVMTDDLADACLRPALDFFDKLIDEMEQDGDVQWVVEKRCEMPGIPDAFGTCDLIVKGAKKTVILDWKFGVGVPVKAIYLDDENGDLLNPQLCYYGRSAMHTLPDMFGPFSVEADGAVWPVELIVAQPRGRAQDEDNAEAERFTRADTDTRELEDFRRTLVARVAEAMGKEPRIRRGDHCRFAKCKTICPKWTQPLADFSKLQQVVEARKATPLGDVFDYGEVYAAGLDLLDLVEPFAAEFRRQAHEYMEQGGSIRDRKLVAKRAVRKWKDEADALDTLRNSGLADNELLETTLRSPAQIEKALKKLKQTLPEELVSAISSGTTMALADDRRKEVIPIGAVVENFAAKLALVAPAVRQDEA